MTLIVLSYRQGASAVYRRRVGLLRGATSGESASAGAAARDGGAGAAGICPAAAAAARSAAGCGLRQWRHLLQSAAPAAARESAAAS